jgi:hypothetical protein
MAWHLALHIRHDAKLPMARFYMFGRQQDYSYALPDPNAQAVRRHHIRIWNTGYTASGIPIWAGAATYDQAVVFAQKGRLFNHTIDPQVDTERDFIGSNLAAASSAHEQYLQPEVPVFRAQTLAGQTYQSDSRILLLNFYQGDTVAAARPGTGASSARPASTLTPASSGVLQSSLK